MEPCDVLIRCSFRSDFSSTGLDNLTFCLLTNLTALGKDAPNEKNIGTLYNEERIWLFYAKSDSTLEFRLCQCDYINNQFERVESELSTHRFQVPNVSADQALTLELKWNDEFFQETISIDYILNENEDLFEKLPFNSDDPNDPGDVNDDDIEKALTINKENLLKCEKNGNNSAKVSPKIRFKITTESLDSICGSSSEIEEIMSHQNNKLGIPISSKTSSSDIASSSSDKKSSGNVSKVNELPEEDEVFSVMETEDGLVDIDKLLFESSNSMEIQNFQTVRTAPVVAEHEKSRSHTLMTKLHALFGFGGLKFSEPHENIKNEELLTHTPDSENKNKDNCEIKQDDENNTTKRDDPCKENLIENENVEVVESHKYADQNTILRKESFQSESENFYNLRNSLNDSNESNLKSKISFSSEPVENSKHLPTDLENPHSFQNLKKEIKFEDDFENKINYQVDDKMDIYFTKNSEELIEKDSKLSFLPVENCEKKVYQDLNNDELVRNSKNLLTDLETSQTIRNWSEEEKIENYSRNYVRCEVENESEINIDRTRTSEESKVEASKLSEDLTGNCQEIHQNFEKGNLEYEDNSYLNKSKEIKIVNKNEDKIQSNYKTEEIDNTIQTENTLKFIENNPCISLINDEIKSSLRDESKIGGIFSSHVEDLEKLETGNICSKEPNTISIIPESFDQNPNIEFRDSFVKTSEYDTSPILANYLINSEENSERNVSIQSDQQPDFHTYIIQSSDNTIHSNDEKYTNKDITGELRNLSFEKNYIPNIESILFSEIKNNNCNDEDSSFLRNEDRVSFDTTGTNAKHNKDNGNQGINEKQLKLVIEEKSETNKDHKMKFKDNFEQMNIINATISDSFTLTEPENESTAKLKECETYTEVTLASELPGENQEDGTNCTLITNNENEIKINFISDSFTLTEPENENTAKLKECETYTEVPLASELPGENQEDRTNFALITKNEQLTNNENEIKINFNNNEQNLSESENGLHLQETEEKCTSLNSLKVITKDEEYFSDLEPISEEFDDKLSNHSDNEVDHNLTNDIVSIQINMASNFPEENFEHTLSFQSTTDVTLPNLDNEDQIKINLEKLSSQTCSKSFHNSDLGNLPHINQKKSIQSTNNKTNKSENCMTYQIPLIYTSNQNLNIDYDVILMENDLNFSLSSTETSFIPNQIAVEIDMKNSLQKFTSMPENSKSNSNGFNIDISWNERKINENLQLQEIESNDSSLVTTLSKESLDENLSTDNLYEKFIPTSETSMTHPNQPVCVSSVASQHAASRATNETKGRELKEASYTGKLEVIANEYYIDRLKNQGCREIISIDSQIHNVGKTGVNACLIDDNTNHQDINLLTNISAISNSGSNNCSNPKLLDVETNDQFNLVIGSSDPEFHADNFDKSSMLNPMLCIFLNKDRNQIKFEEQGTDSTLMQQGLQLINKVSVETSISSNRDSAIICDSDLVSDSQSAVETIVQDDSFEESVYNHPMTTSQTVDSLFISALSSNKPTISKENEPSYFSRGNSHEVIFDDTHLFLSDKGYSLKPATPNEYCSLPIPHRSKMKRSPALDGVCDLLKKTDSELKLIEQQTNLIINDDDLYPDSVTPSKADISLRFGERIYDFPYIDDESSNDLLFNILLDRHPVRAKLADCDECTLISTTDLLENNPVEKSPKQLIATVVKKKSKTRNKFSRLCGCLSRKRN